MNPLLEWGLTHSDPQKLSQAMQPGSRTAEQSAQLLRENQALMDELMKTDAQRMKAALAKAMDVKEEVEDREDALDELEMLVESIDNANDLASTKGIAPLLCLLEDPAPSIQMHAAWVLGTSVQNNERFAKALLAANGLEALLAVIQRNTSESGVTNELVVARAVYTVSGCMRASREALEEAISKNGLKTLILLFFWSSDLNLNLLRKLAFFFAGIIVEHYQTASLIPHLLENQLLEGLIQKLSIDDLDLREKIFECLEAAFNHSPAAVAKVTESSLKADLQKWVGTAQIPSDNKAHFSSVLSKVGIAL